MSSDNPSTNRDAAINQARTDVNNGYGSPNSHTWNNETRLSYENERRHQEELRRQQNS